MDNRPISLAYVRNELKTQELCDNAFRSDMSNFKFIPIECRTQEMYTAIFFRNPSYYKSRIPDENKTKEMCQKMFSMSPNNIKYIPDKHKTEEMCKIAFELDANNIKYIPDKYKTEEMCKIAFELDANNIVYIPDKYKTQEMCKIAFELDSNNIVYVPLKFQTQAEWDSAVKKYSNTQNDKNIINEFIKKIPIKFQTQEIWNKLVEHYVSQNRISPEMIKKIPFQFQTQEIWRKLVKCFCNSSASLDEKIKFVRNVPSKFQTFEIWYELVSDVTGYLWLYDDKRKQEKLNIINLIPSQFKKQVYITYLKNEFYQASKIIPITDWDADIFSMVFVELKKLMDQNKKIPCDSKLCLYVVRLYPGLNGVLDKKTNDYIRDDLYDLITNSSTAELIAEKHQVSVQTVNNVLESIKEYDIEGYKAIKRVLACNQNNYFFDIMNDVYKLGEIILSLGFVNTKFLNIEQKVKFAYLYNKHVHHSLEEIYNFNYKKYDNKYAKVLDRFFKGILKYNYLADDYTMLPEKKTILFNNSWLKKYDRDKFFGIKNGIPTIESKFGQNQTVLTLEIEQGIINILKENEIPLIDVIVRTAFKEYFDGTLSEYITKIKEYDTIFEDNKHKKL